MRFRVQRDDRYAYRIRSSNPLTLLYRVVATQIFINCFDIYINNGCTYIPSRFSLSIYEHLFSSLNDFYNTYFAAKIIL